MWACLLAKNLLLQPVNLIAVHELNCSVKPKLECTILWSKCMKRISSSSNDCNTETNDVSRLLVSSMEQQASFKFRRLLWSSIKDCSRKRICWSGSYKREECDAAKLMILTRLAYGVNVTFEEVGKKPEFLESLPPSDEATENGMRLNF